MINSDKPSFYIIKNLISQKMNFLKKVFQKKPSPTDSSPSKKLRDFFGARPRPPIKCCCCEFSSYLINTQTSQRIPLKSLNYEIEVIDSLAYITLNQNYFNDSSQNIETEFLFSITNESCFYDFEAQIDDRIIKGDIKEKEEAKQEYESNIKKGNMAAFSEITSEMQDIVKIKVGNIPPNKAIAIRFRYIQRLEISMNKFWRLTIPSTLTPRYQSRHKISKAEDDITLTNLKQINPDDPLQKYPWSIKTTITSSSQITFIKSPSHSINTEFLDQSQTKCTITFQNEEVPNKDFTIVFKNDEINKPHCMLAHKENDEEYPYCAMLSFFPQFNSASDNDAYEAFLQNSVKNDYKISALKSKGEFIFVLDRSGSMSGGRIEMAKQALILFLKSMPPDSYYNIVSFGSRFAFISKESQKYSEEKVEKSIQKINKFSADLGGTELIDPLHAVFKTKPFESYPKNIFLLTDGGIDDTKHVLDLIEKNNEGCRVYTIGIGNGCSRELITEGANAGKGKFEFIADNEDMNAKIIGLLQDSLTPFLSEILLEYDKNVVEMITPLPESVQFVRKNEALTFFVFFNKKFEDLKTTSFKLSFVDSLKKERQMEEMKIQINDLTLQQDFLHRYGLFQLIKRVSMSISYEKDYKKDVFIAKKQDIDAFCLNLAIRFKILTTFTAFICVIQEKDPNDLSKFLKKVIIPSIESCDYSYAFRDEPQNLMPMKPMKKMMQKCSVPQKIQSKTMKKAMFAPREMKMEKASKKDESCCYDDEAEMDICEEFNVDFKQKKKEIVKPTKKFESSLEKDEENKDVLMKVIGKQKAGGYWEEKAEVLALIGVSAEEIYSKMPSGIKGKEIWLTVIILCFFEMKFMKNEGSWRLIAQKAEEYLEDNGINYSLFKEKAEEFFKK